MTATSDNLDTIEQRPAHADEIPDSAKRLALLAGQHGWTAQTVYSRGTRLGSKTPADHVSVRLDCDGHALVGMWVDGAWRCGLVGLHGRQLLRKLSSRELTAAVRGEQ